jgi:hypothetical protein
MAYTDGDDDRLADDGQDADGDAPSGASAAPAKTLGFILDEPDPRKVAAAVVKLRDDQAALRSRNRATWQRNMWWREGRRGVRLEKKQNESKWEAKLPLGMGSAPPVPNKTDRLCRRLTNVILVDKPFPECEPAGDHDEDRDAAEFATRFLAVKGSPAELNMNRILRAASDKAMTYASAFGWVTMDPTAGGHRPRSMLAHPGATTTDNALLDPKTGMEAAESELLERYIRDDGTLSDQPSEAALQWLPGPRVRLLTGLQVDLLPPTARGIQDAIGVVITEPTTLGDLRLLFPEAMAKLSKDALGKLCAWRPTDVKDVLPPYTQMPEDQKDDEDNYQDAQTVITTTVYYKSSAEYPFGCYAVIGGDCHTLHRQKWSALMPSRKGAPVEECLEIPVAQARCLDDDISDNPMGVAMAEHLGPADEVRNVALGFEIEHMFRSANPIPFLPVGSIVQPKQLTERNGSPVFVNPQGKAEWEQVPALSQTVPLLRAEMSAEMDDESGLQEAAQGVTDPSVKSGTHAQAIVQEALKAVINMKDNLGDFYIALNRIILQQARAFCSVPQLIAYVGENGAYKQREWSRADFGTTRQVSIAKGSFTMHTLLAKQEMANAAFDRKIIDADEYQDFVTAGISPVMGARDNPHLMRVRRQIEAWQDGPTAAWKEAQLKQAMALAEAQTMSLANPDAPVPPPPPAEPVAHPFSDRLPVDLEPAAAKIRHRQLGRTMADAKWMRQPPAWRALYLAEYEAMANAAGIITVEAAQKAQEAEKQAAQAAQQQAAKAAQDAAAQAAQAAQQEAAQKAQELATKAALDQQEAERRANAEAAKLAQDATLAREKMALEAQLATAKIAAEERALAAKLAAEREQMMAEAQKATAAPVDTTAIDRDRMVQEAALAREKMASEERIAREKLALEERKAQLDRDMRQYEADLEAHTQAVIAEAAAKAQAAQAEQARKEQEAKQSEDAKRDKDEKAEKAEKPEPVIVQVMPATPTVTVEAPTPAPKAKTKKKGTITAPDGKSYRIETTEE